LGGWRGLYEQCCSGRGTQWNAVPPKIL